MFGVEDKTITFRTDQRSLTIDLVIEAHADATQEGADADANLLGDIIELLNSEGAITFSLDQRVALVNIFRNEKAYIADGDILYTDPQLTHETLDGLIELLNTPAGE